MFDLALSYPQWQGSGRPQHLPRGAAAAAEVVARYAPLARVSVGEAGAPFEGVNGWTAILEQFRAARALLADRQPARVLTAGGDCACDVAVIDYLHDLYPDLTVLWVDAHLDANTPATSPSGNFHGMPVAAILGASPAALAPHLGAPLSAARFRYVSAHVGDPGEWSFQRARTLSWLDDAEPLVGPVHVHFDLDALDPAEFPHVAYPEGRMSLESGLELVRRVAGRATLVGLTVTEFAPQGEAEARAGSEYIARLCDAATRRGRG